MSSKVELPKTTRDRILDAALHLFLEVGFDRANLDKIAAKAGVTKPTIYSHFGSKIGLLQALALWQTERALSNSAPNLSPSGDPRTDLLQFAKNLIGNMLSPEALHLHRFAITEAIKHPELVKPLLDSGPGRLQEALAGYLAMQTQAGKLRCGDPAMAAKHLTGLLAGGDFLNTIITQQVPDLTELKARLESAIDLFLAYYLVQGDRSNALP